MDTLEQRLGALAKKFDTEIHQSFVVNPDGITRVTVYLPLKAGGTISIEGTSYASTIEQAEEWSE